MSGLNAETLSVLRAIVGADAVLTEAADRRRYEAGARYGDGVALAVVRPATVEQVSAVVACAVQHGVPVLPQGGITGLVGGSVPDASGTQLVLSLDRLREPLEIDAANRTVRVGAGVRLSALNAALEPHGLFLPIDLGADPMIGGMVATNTAGARFLRYGDMRRHVLSLQVVQADSQGAVLELKKGLRKDNTALDLAQLFVGSWGVLGVVTSAQLEVHRRPQQSAAAILAPRDVEAVLDILAHFEEGAGEYLSAFEGMSRGALSYAFAHNPRLRNPFPNGALPEYAVLVELTRSWATRESEESLDAVLEACLAPMWDADPSPLLDGYVGRPEELWAVRHSISEGLRAAGDVIGFDLAFRRSDVPAFRRQAVASLSAKFPEFVVCDFGHVGDGGVHFNLVRPLGGDPLAPGRIESLRDHVLNLAVRQFDGSYSGEHGVGRANQTAYDAFTPPSIVALSEQIRSVFAAAPMGAVRVGPPAPG